MPRRTKQGGSPIVDRIAENCLAMRVRRLNRVITGIYDDELRDHGLTTAQLNVLVVIARRGPIAPAQVAKLLRMEKSTLSRNLERMRSQGWVRVSPGAGRGQLLEVYAKGRRLLEAVEPAWRRAERRAESLLGEREAQAVRRAGNAAVSRPDAPIP